MKLMVNGEPLDALASVMHRSLTDRRGRAWVQKLKPMVDRQYFEVVIQAAIGKRVIAREAVKPFRKDVTAKLYGGDHTRYYLLIIWTEIGGKSFWKSKKSEERECGVLEVWISLRKHSCSFYNKTPHLRTFES